MNASAPRSLLTSTTGISTKSKTLIERMIKEIKEELPTAALVRALSEGTDSFPQSGQGLADASPRARHTRHITSFFSSPNIDQASPGKKDEGRKTCQQCFCGSSFYFD